MEEYRCIAIGKVNTFELEQEGIDVVAHSNFDPEVIREKLDRYKANCVVFSEKVPIGHLVELLETRKIHILLFSRKNKGIYKIKDMEVISEPWKEGEEKFYL